MRIRSLKRPLSAALRHPSLGIALIYTIVSLFWILLSDRLLLLFVSSPAVLTSLQTLKGWLFVLISAGLVYDLVRRVTKAQERSQAERYAQEQLFRNVFEQAAMGMALVSPAGRWLRVNQKLCNILGYNQTELMAFTVHDVVHPHDLNFGLAYARRALAGELSNYTIEIRCLQKKGGVISIKLTTVLTRRPSGEPDYFVAVLEDITQYKHLETLLHHAQKMEAIGQLAGGIAHDFNNILVVIAGYTELLLSKRPDADDPLHRDLEQIKKSANRAAELTQKLLAFSRRQALQPQPVNLSHQITDMKGMLQRAIGERIELVTTLAEDLDDVMVDPGGIEQVIMNLVINARDAMPQGGRLTIETANVELAETESRPLVEIKPGAYVLLTVADTGQGMPEEIQAKMFEPFFTTKEQGQGTGLGLAIVYGLVQQSDGYIDVKSRPDQGTTLRIYLPRALPLKAQQDSPVDRLTRPLRGAETVLVVEDEPGVKELVEAILTDYGYTVLTAADGLQALALFQGYPGRIDLVLTDVILPGMYGQELAEKLSHSCPGLKVLFMSGYSDHDLGIHGVPDLGASLLQKPFSPEALVEQVREALDERMEE